MAVLRRAAWCALALAAACGAEKTAGPAPLTGIRLPTGMAVQDGRVLVVDSNADLLYDEGSGGVLLDLVIGPSFAVSTVGAVRTHSMGGDLAVARPDAVGTGFPAGEACAAAADLPPALAVSTTPLAVFATRGSNTLNVVAVAGGERDALSCTAPGARCGIPTNGAGFGDPYALAVACGGGRARAYVGYLSAQGTAGWVGELDLRTLEIKNQFVGQGAVRGLAYDRDRDRLYLTGLATGLPTPLRWVNLSGCDFGSSVASEACSYGSVQLPVVAGTFGVELHGIALARRAVQGSAEPIRAYASGLLYDLAAAASAGYRTTAFGSVLVVMDLYDDPFGGVEPRIVAIHDVPGGAQTVSVLPRPTGWPVTRRDVIAVVSSDTGSLTVLDDETGAMDVFGLDASGPSATGAPILGHQAYGLAVDPLLSGSTARLWIGSFLDGFITPLDVTVDPSLVATFAGGAQVKITGATP